MLFAFPVCSVYFDRFFYTASFTYRLRIFADTLCTFIRHDVIMFFRPEIIMKQCVFTKNKIPVVDLPPVNPCRKNCGIRTQYFTNAAVCAICCYFHRHFIISLPNCTHSYLASSYEWNKFGFAKIFNE